MSIVRQQFWRRMISSLLVAVAMLLSPWTADAQGQDQRSPFWDVTRRVALDPTTYAPSVIMYHSAMLDWSSSRPFFRNGFVEHNRRFTVSGLPDDDAISYGAGRKLIRADTLETLGVSMANNAAASLTERVLIQRYPSHRTLFRALGWIERISLSSYWSYRLSVGHYRQWQRNEQQSRQLGIR
jgi:hypothetical protein